MSFCLILVPFSCKTVPCRSDRTKPAAFNELCTAVINTSSSRPHNDLKPIQYW